MINKEKKIIAIILARKNSKRIKNKNIMKIAGIPLIEHSINSALESNFIDEVYVSSDSDKIKKICSKKNVNFIKRPKYLAGDNVHSEEVLENLILKINKIDKIDIVVFIQPTSPLRPVNVFDNAIKFFLKKRVDSLFSSTIFKNHIWSKLNKLKPINYNFKNRKFDQQKNNQLNENGSFYIFKADKFLKFRNRLFGKIINYEIDYQYSFQVDEIIDASIIDYLFLIEKKL